MNPGDVVKVRGFAGVACRFRGHAQTWEPWTALVTDPETGDEYEEDTGEGEYIDDESRAVVSMVGDDPRTKFTVDIDDVEPLAEDAYCAECGQLACAWGRA